MNNLAKKSFAGLGQFQAFLLFLLFVPAWSLRFWEAWVYWTLFSLCLLGITLYFLKYDPGLVERRLHVGPGAEPVKSQKIIQTIASLLICALFIVPGFDYRLHWSNVSVPVVWSAEVLVVVSFLIMFVVFRENSYTAGVVRVEEGQKVISTGPYAWVRHPLYAGAALLFLATPLALGSLLALLVAVALCAILVVRLLDEERYLTENLAGYRAYCEKIRYHLIPFVW